MRKSWCVPLSLTGERAALTREWYAIRERYNQRRYVSRYNADRKKGRCILGGLPYIFESPAAAALYMTMRDISFKQYKIVRIYIIEEKCEA